MTGITIAGDDNGTEPQTTCITCIIAATKDVEVFEAGGGTWAERADAVAAMGGMTTTDDTTASESKVIVHGVVQTLLGEHRKELLEEHQMGVELVLIGCISVLSSVS